MTSLARVPSLIICITREKITILTLYGDTCKEKSPFILNFIEISDPLFETCLLSTSSFPKNLIFAELLT